MTEPALPVVAIAGRPNVGKSTLWNRLVGRGRAIVEDVPGVTRDRLYGEAEWRGRRFQVVDTGGWRPGKIEPLWESVRVQVERALDESCAVVLVVDGRASVSDADRELARALLRRGKPVVLAVNKLDTPGASPADWGFTRLGAGEGIRISALHGIAVDDLLDRVLPLLPPAAEPGASPAAPPVRLAIVGRPNVGKSSIANALLRDARSVVDDRPGTTRDAVDTPLDSEHGAFILIDTAGLRRRTRLSDPVDLHSAERALSAVRRCDVAALVVDGIEGVAQQEAAIGSQVVEAGAGCILAINKWDLVLPKDTDTARRYVRQVRERLPFLAWAPILTLSAKTGQRVDRLLSLAAYVAGQHAFRLGTAQVNEFLAEATAAKSPPTRHGRAVRIKFAAQVSVKPPTIALFVNHPEALSETYTRYLAGRLRERYGFEGTPIRFVLKAGGLPRARPARPR